VPSSQLERAYPHCRRMQPSSPGTRRRRRRRLRRPARQRVMLRVMLPPEGARVGRRTWRRRVLLAPSTASFLARSPLPAPSRPFPPPLAPSCPFLPSRQPRHCSPPRADRRRRGGSGRGGPGGALRRARDGGCGRRGERRRVVLGPRRVRFGTLRRGERRHPATLCRRRPPPQVSRDEEARLAAERERHAISQGCIAEMSRMRRDEPKCAERSHPVSDGASSMAVHRRAG